MKSGSQKVNDALQMEAKIRQNHAELEKLEARARELNELNKEIIKNQLEVIRTMTAEEVDEYSTIAYSR